MQHAATERRGIPPTFGPHTASQCNTVAAAAFQAGLGPRGSCRLGHTTLRPAVRGIKAHAPYQEQSTGAAAGRDPQDVRAEGAVHQV